MIKIKPTISFPPHKFLTDYYWLTSFFFKTDKKIISIDMCSTWILAFVRITCTMVMLLTI